MICLDTAIIIWGVQCVEDKYRPDLPRRVGLYLKQISERGERVMIPAPVIHEFLTGVVPEERQGLLNELNKMFYIPSFDLSAAVLAAELDGDRDEMRGIRKDYHLRRQEIKIDTQIIAIAIMHQATEIITDNVEHFRKIAKNRIKISELPTISSQEALFTIPPILEDDIL